MNVSRRTLLRALAAVPLAAGCAVGEPAEPLVLAAGEPGGFYVEFGELLAQQLRAAGIPAEVTGTGGSVDNVAHVAGGSAAVGLSLTDIALAARAGEPPFPAPVPLLAIGRVYENYMQLVVRAEDPITEVADLAGRPISLGAVGSGAAVFGDRLLAVAGVAARVTRRPLRDAVAALADGRADALLWSGGVPTPGLAELAALRPIRLLPLDAHLAGLRARHGGAYGPVTVPAGAYGTARPVPTVGVANLLVCGPTLPAAVAAAVARTLVGAAPALVPASALGTQYLDQRSLIGTGDVPLHPGAAAAYRDLHG
ncbi:TAXI family TRAP transporter solute-binding subunit [Pseudonocardia nigra]|uniref:TAXI family TRAP transporter solute-binding subunit n=1 Tax=Pseudonocardia nigra TaxID=1921578 RepID=UPI001C5FD549|nr:TAXI family TRAP transporter solute-binding subunit [Pseudonocardia nigra]